MDGWMDRKAAGTKPSHLQTDHGAAVQTQGLGGKVSCDGHTDGWTDGWTDGEAVGTKPSQLQTDHGAAVRTQEGLEEER